MNSPFLASQNAKKMLSINIVFAVVYFVGLVFLFQRGNIYLYSALILGEIYHLWQVGTLINAAWDTRIDHPFSSSFTPPIDVYITVAGEPKAVVKKTLKAAVAMDYPEYHVYILNDGFVAKKSNWHDMEDLAREFQDKGVSCITRRQGGGAKAGNINNALQQTSSPYVAILDCDHAPGKDFLKSSAGYFIDDKVAFVQSPQYYRNNTASYVANAAWQQQTLFFGPICRGKDRTNSLFMCGTNMVIRRQALEDVGGMQEASITEDLLTSLLMHSRGWRSVYVPRILAQGLAPEDFSAYWQQQFRWARGSLEVLLKYNPLFLPGLNWRQRLQYLASMSFYISGLVVLADALLPLFYFYGGLIPISSDTMAIALIFIPYIFLTLYALQRISSFAFSFRAIAFSIASWPIYILAMLLTLLRIRSSFKVTAKERQTGNYMVLVVPHILYILAVVVGIGWMAYRHGIDSSLITNASWGILYVVMFLPFVRAALPDKMLESLSFSDVELPAEELSNE